MTIRFIATSLVFAALAIPLQAQLLVPYTSQAEIATATETARDSLGDDVELIAIATTGEIDLSPVGLSGTVSGFDEDGESSVWGYQFTTADDSEQLGVAVINFPFGSPFIQTEGGNLYDVELRELDLSGNFSGSDAFANALSTTAAYETFMSDYPDAVADAVVLAWNPDDADLLLPSGFPRNLPLWSIYFNTTAFGSSDSGLVCFMATGTGQTICYRSDAPSSAPHDERGTEGESLSIAHDRSLFVNGTRTGVIVRLNLPSATRTSLILYNVAGEVVVDYSDLVPPGGSGSIEMTLQTSDLPGGRYFLHASTQDQSATVSLLVE